MNQTCQKRLIRLKTIVSLHEEKKEVLAQIRSMRQWVMEVEHILDGSWAAHPEERSLAEVGRRLDAWLSRLATFLQADGRTEDEQLRLGHLLKVLSHLRPGLVHCYDVEGFPRTNNDRERPSVPSKCTIGASADAKTGTAIYCAMDAVSSIKNGGISNRMGMLACMFA